ncbi:FG-GAP repeat domain-containing protein [Streptomyces huiliensis]|uniref:FG-GAP repeat domain-containing protein n=1 Tax=Streptomyces huiliensis TaxID=2876027 RepID=UPI001CBF7994|nr:VCBS repeat-containing protein [Streptomyces huiliensis]MBZ4322356.1 VCBS repeat-containing protein [Streptomyces huiliensis]
MRTSKAIAALVPIALGAVLALPAAASADGSRHGSRAAAAAPAFGSFLLQTGTALHETDDTFATATADWNRDGRPDLVAVKKSRTGTGSTEVHVLG